MEKKWRRYRVRPLAVVVGIAIDIVILVLYIVSIYLQGRLPDGWSLLVVNVLSNVLLVGFSVLTTSLISIPFIDVREKNELCAEMLLGDVLKTPKVFNTLTQEQKEEVLHSLECSTYLDNCEEKGKMLRSIRNKINGDKDKQEHVTYHMGDCFFYSCEYEVECVFDEGYIKKRITKTFDLRSYKPITITQFPLCSSTFADTKGRPYSSIDVLNINEEYKNIDKDVKQICDDMTNDEFEKKSGYAKKARHCYMKELLITPDKPTKIMIAYTTTVPDNDIAYSCRMVYPCRKFSFKFKLTGPDADKYHIGVNAFGFWDNGKSTPNRSDSPEVKVVFNDWIFPRDGVAVTLMRKKGET